MIIYKDELLIYYEELDKYLKNKYKNISFTLSYTDINNFIDNILIVINIKELNIKREIQIETELVDGYVELDNLLKQLIDSKITLSINEHFYK